MSSRLNSPYSLDQSEEKLPCLHEASLHRQYLDNFSKALKLLKEHQPEIEVRVAPFLKFVFGDLIQFSPTTLAETELHTLHSLMASRGLVIEDTKFDLLCEKTSDLFFTKFGHTPMVWRHPVTSEIVHLFTEEQFSTLIVPLLDEL